MHKLLWKLSLVLSLFFIISCTNNSEKEEKEEEFLIEDMHSFANPNEIDYQHLSLDLNVSFDEKQLKGSATWTYQKKAEGVNYIQFDTRDLFIEKVIDQNGDALKFELGNHVQYLGQELSIEIKESSGTVQIFYETKEGAEALQWLEANQTFGKKQPFLYTQSETIYARSWIPSPDGPGIRFTYDANIQVPQGMMALMSAQNNPQSKTNNGVYQFEMHQAIPAYLLALAVGDLQFKAIDDRTGVYAEPSQLTAAYEEFNEIGEMVNVAEELYGKYRWNRYDMLVLPSGFPFGGMENPELTFLTPTIISGDKTLLNLIAHELAHSWSGNLVTNATWEDFWLNEGFTVYFERRITEAIHGKDYTDMLWSLSLQSLQSTLEVMEARDTWMKLDLKDKHPDGGLTDISYDKGALFLRKVEETIGREEMDKFLIDYFNHFAFKTISSEQFVQYFNKHVIKDNKDWAKEINLKAWIYGPGIPDNHPVYEVKRFEKVDEAIQNFIADAEYIVEIDREDWSTYEYLHFLNGIEKDAKLKHIESIDQHWHFTKSNNMEILSLWLKLCIQQEYKDAYSRLDQFLDEVGRMKFLEELYPALKKSSLGKEGTINLYQQKKHNYHPITQMEIESLIGLK